MRRSSDAAVITTSGRRYYKFWLRSRSRCVSSSSESAGDRRY